jgi:hypothetical protein
MRRTVRGGAERRQGTKVGEGTAIVEKRVVEVHAWRHPHFPHDLPAVVDGRRRTPIPVQTHHRHPVREEGGLNEPRIVAGTGQRDADDLPAAVDPLRVAEMPAQGAQISYDRAVIEEGMLDTRFGQESADYLTGRVN